MSGIKSLKFFPVCLQQRGRRWGEEGLVVEGRSILWVGDAVSRVDMQTLATASCLHIGAHPGLAVGRRKFTLAAFSGRRLKRGHDINFV